LAWKIEIKKTAEKQIARFETSIQRRIIKALREISDYNNPRHSGKALKGNKEQLWRYRVGDYRLICKVDDEEKVVFVLHIAHRKEVYR
jgi:mRNA interferase RelE/StbE